MHITHHRTPNSICACILPHAHRKSPERTWTGDQTAKLASIGIIFSAKNVTVQKWSVYSQLVLFCH